MTVQIPAEMRPNKLATLKCKVDTSAGGNVMPLCAFAKLFPRHIKASGSPRGLKWSMTCLTAYNRSKIPQFGTLDTAINWNPKGKDVANHLQTQWYIADTLGSAILGIPSCAKLGVVEHNCAVNLQKRKLVQQKKPTTEGRKVNQDLQHFKSPPLNTKPVIHTPRKCPIAMWPLVWEKLDEFWNKESSSNWRNPQTGYPHLPTPGRQMASWESVWIPKMLTKPSKETITRPPLLKRSHIYWQEARSLPSLMEPHHISA